MQERRQASACAVVSVISGARVPRPLTPARQPALPQVSTRVADGGHGEGRARPSAPHPASGLPLQSGVLHGVSVALVEPMAQNYTQGPPALKVAPKHKMSQTSSTAQYACHNSGIHSSDGRTGCIKADLVCAWLLRDPQVPCLFTSCRVYLMHDAYSRALAPLLKPAGKHPEGLESVGTRVRVGPGKTWLGSCLVGRGCAGV